MSVFECQSWFKSVMYMWLQYCENVWDNDLAELLDITLPTDSTVAEIIQLAKCTVRWTAVATWVHTKKKNNNQDAISKAPVECHISLTDISL